MIIIIIYKNIIFYLHIIDIAVYKFAICKALAPRPMISLYLLLFLYPLWTLHLLRNMQFNDSS